jgi:hypothetical protein
MEKNTLNTRIKKTFLSDSIMKDNIYWKIFSYLNLKLLCPLHHPHGFGHALGQEFFSGEASTFLLLMIKRQ